MQVNPGLPAALLQIVAREQQGGDFICAVGELCLLLFLLGSDAALQLYSTGVRQSDGRSIVLLIEQAAGGHYPLAAIGAGLYLAELYSVTHVFYLVILARHENEVAVVV